MGMRAWEKTRREENQLIEEVDTLREGKAKIEMFQLHTYENLFFLNTFFKSNFKKNKVNSY